MAARSSCATTSGPVTGSAWPAHTTRGSSAASLRIDARACSVSWLKAPVRDVRRVATGRLRIDRVEAVGHQGQPVGLPEQPDQPRSVAGQLEDPEARHLVTLAHRVGDLDRPAVPQAEQTAVDRPGIRPQEREVPVRADRRGRLRRRSLGGMAEHRHALLRGRAAVVAVGVAEHDPAQAAEPGGEGAHRAGHVGDAGIEHRHPALVGDEVDVHRPGPAAAHHPHAVGDPLGLGAPQRVAHARAEVGQRGDPRLGRRAGRRQDTELARHVGTVEVRLVGHDPLVGHRHHVAAGQLDPRAVGLRSPDSPPARRTCRWPASAPRCGCGRWSGRPARAGSRGRRRAVRRSTPARHPVRPRHGRPRTGQRHPATSSRPLRRGRGRRAPRSNGGRSRRWWPWRRAV